MRRALMIVALTAMGLALSAGLGACRRQPPSPAPPAHQDASTTAAPPDADGGAGDAASPGGDARGTLLLGATDEALCVVEGDVMRRWGVWIDGRGRTGSTVVTFPERVARLACGKGHVCVATEGGDIWCMGYGGFGELGVVTTELCPGFPGRDEPCSTSPVKVPGLPRMIDVAVGGGSCGVSEAGDVYCWGGRAWSELTDAGEHKGAKAHNPEAIFRVPGLSDIRRIGMGGGYACALDARREMWCWGTNQYGVLGRGTHEDRNLPPARVSSLHGVSAMAVGGDHACALVEGEVYCWGFNGLYAVNDKVEARCEDKLPCAPSPRRVVVPSSAKIVGLPRAGVSTCALDAAGAIYCWGANRGGTLGPGGEPCEMQPCLRHPKKLLGLPPMTQIVVAGSFMCGLDASRELSCWGDLAGELRVPPNESAQCPDCVGPLFRRAF